MSARTAKRSRAGTRQQKKLETRQRIRTAAYELFSKRGYDQATLRGIAQQAHVALGTLFNYADDKRDLVFLIVNEELDQVTTESLRAAGRSRSLLEQLMALFRLHYEYFARNTGLSRILLRELVFYSSGKQAEEFHEIRERLFGGIEALIQEAQKARRLSTREDAAVIARHIFFTFSAAVRWWIATPHPKPGEGIEDLRRLLKLQFRGLEIKS